MRFDPELARAVATMPDRPGDSDVPDADYGAVRAAAHAYFALHPSSPPPDVTQEHAVVAPSGIPARIYRPKGIGDPAPALVWVHGGGVPVEVHHYAGVFHGFEAIGLPVAVAWRAFDEQGRALSDALRTTLVVL